MFKILLLSTLVTGAALGGSSSSAAARWQRWSFANDIELPDLPRLQQKKCLKEEYPDQPWKKFPVHLGYEEIKKIKKCLTLDHVNEYGDLVGTMYSSGSPLFNETTGETIDRFAYIISNDFNNDGNPDACDPKPVPTSY